jgi:hypothetical protein
MLRVFLFLLLLFSAIRFGICTAPDSSTPTYQSPGTKKMAALLLKIYNEQDWETDPNKDAERAQYFKSLLAAKPPYEKEIQIRKAIADCLLRAGDSAGSVEQLESIRKLSHEKHTPLQPKFDKEVRDALAISYLRLGEQENCIAMHGQQSCIFPLKGSGVHKMTRGAEGAVRELTAALEQSPKDLKSRWLLNIAYMQLGRYPEGVPQQWLFPPSTFVSDADIGVFPEVAPQASILTDGHSGGVVMEDFDGDGLLDLVISSSGPLDQIRYFHNDGDGYFSDRTKQSGLIGELGGLNVISGDFNNDGYPDLLVLRGGWWAEHGKYPMSLMRNNGNGTFDDVTEEAGLLSLHPTQTAAWADFDGDGWLDLFVGHEQQGKESHPSQLFHNNHDGTFTEVGAADKVADLGFVKGVAWGDFNNDGRPDLYISRKGQPNILFRNDGPKDKAYPRPDRWQFTDVTEEAGVAEPLQSFPTFFFDYDNDGWPDLFVGGFWYDTLNDIGSFQMKKFFRAETPRLYHNNRNGTFTDVTKLMKLDRAIVVMGAGFGDLDNDGWLDVYLGTGDPAYEALLPNRMFRNNEGKGFQDITTSGGFGELQKGHGIAFGDLSNNGQEDVFEVIGGALPGDNYQSILFQNPGHPGNHWITFELEGVQTNRAAFGARICVTVLNGKGKRRIYRTVGYGSSFGSNPIRQHIGVGPAAEVEEVEIEWPVSKSKQRFRHVPIDQVFHVLEGKDVLTPVQPKSFVLAPSALQHPHRMEH